MAGILDLVGNTPMVKLDQVSANKNVTIYGKLEGNNPGGSVKDRAAYGMIKGAFDRGEISKGITLIEATSGNTGIALAMIASLFKVPIELVMPENSTRERVLTMQAFGAKVILTPKERSIEGAIDYANAQVAKGGYFMLNQFANPDNPGMHYKTTGPEIWQATDGKVDVLISGVGTGGTLTGISRYLKHTCKRPILSVAVEPESSPVITQRLAGETLKPAPHKIQGIGAGFIPGTLDLSLVDRVERVSNDESVDYARRLATEEGILSGISCGAAT
ncbi:PLP-dependent cysteine synthase family protein, partial [Ferruginibacter sp.]|uniref:PLP-dependent cysteine synthase family protein n=1 Tax=Ferruginibacter sp. TaxID=1940288 RepID=UPI00265A4C6E